jgi:hypothetical protein
VAAKKHTAKLARMDSGETPASAGVMIAQQALKTARRGKPTEADRPPPSLFPMTPAARAAIQLRKNQGKPGVR